jgi:hypothetical protein
MKWPDDSKITPEVQDRLNGRLAQFLAEDGSSDGGKDSAAVRLLCLDLYSIYHGCEETNDEVVKLFDFAFNAAEWDTEEPALAHIQKYINRLFTSRDEEANSYLDRAINERIDEDADVAAATMSQHGSRGGTASQLQNRKAVAAALQHYQQHHAQFRNKKEAAWHYENLFPPVKFSTYYRILRKPKV